MQRRNFIRLAGGGTLAAAVAGTTGCVSGDYPAQAVEAWRGPGAEADPRRRAVAYAITAPNPHNLQPWLVDLREAGAITLYTDASRILPETDPMGRQILIGHGAFLELLVIALAEQGLRSEVTLWPRGELPSDLQAWRAAWEQRPIARIALQSGAVKDSLFQYILNRHTPKTNFDVQKPVAADTLRAVLTGAGNASARAGGTVDAAAVAPLRELCWQSAQVELKTPRTVLESMRLTRVGPAEILQHRDGITINSPFVRAVSALGMFDRSVPPAEGSAGLKTAMERFEGHSRTAMGFVWLTGPNTRADQIQVGRAYVRLQLQATAQGLGMHPMSQALQEFAEMAPHYERAHQLVLGKPAPKGATDDTVQMLCRVGYTAAPAPATPRRAMGEFLRV